MFLMKAYAVTGAGNWVTINGTHVLIGGNGKIIKGPAKFIGSTIEGMKNAGLESKDKNEVRGADESGGSFKPTTDSLRELQVGDSISFTNSFGEKETFVKTTNPSGRKSDPPVFVYADESGNPKSMTYTDNRVSVFGPSELVKRASLGQGSVTLSKGAFPDIPRRVNQKINGFIGETGISSSYTRVTSSGSSNRYPSGITTPAQKRAYTRAINSGMTSSEAKKSALGSASTKTKSSSGEFKRLTDSQIKKMSTETLLKTHNDYQSKMTVAGFNGNKRLANKYDRESLRLFEEYDKRLSRRK